MKKFTVPCRFGPLSASFNVYLGQPVDDAHPLEQQIAWLRRDRGGVMPAEVVDSFAKLHEISIENGVDFEELCVYALGTQQAEPTAAAENETTPEPGASV